MLFNVSYTLFFFFKQKTAYEMRISDWSSDVCSSDLSVTIAPVDLDGNIRYIAELDAVVAALLNDRIDVDVRARPPRVVERRNSDRAAVAILYGQHAAPESKRRSEEHTSELQSLMRLSYAVFCLNKKKQKKHTRTYDSL